MNPSIFFLSSQACHFEALARSDQVEVSLAIGRRSSIPLARGALRHARVYHLGDAYLGRPLDGSRPRGVSRDLLKALQPYEQAAKLMLDRHNWDGESAMRLHELFVTMVGIWDELLDRHQPDAVILNDAPHRGFDHVLYGLCQVRGIDLAFTTNTLFENRLMFHRHPDVPSAIPAAQLAPVDHTPMSESSYIRDDVTRQRDVARARTSLAVHRVIGPRALRPGWWATLWRPGLRGTMPLGPTTGVAELLNDLRVRRRIRRAIASYADLAAPVPADRPFVYYAMHLQPEATTVPLAGGLYDQANNVRLLADGVPDDWLVVVKEHPQMARYRLQWDRARDPGFYQRLAEHPKVWLAPLDGDQDGLIRDARLVATSTGTIGYEALQAGRPVLAFGNPWYSALHGVTRVGDADEVRRAIDAEGRGEFDLAPDAVTSDLESLREEWTVPGIFHESQLTGLANPAPLLDSYVRAVVSCARLAVGSAS